MSTPVHPNPAALDAEIRDRIAANVAASVARREQRRQQRAQLAQRRATGLRRRHAQKINRKGQP
ncbi:hypothetical protein [Micromonospora coerulea]|uniref:hypothetical protein n=1 Tax=Micromonospora coerulea TaxID=47856 RepID=UPI00190624E3|nr:hypothetical protein [Micromonospora veneta]